MAGKTVNPTRMELTRLKGRLKTASRGHKLLKDKRDEQMRQFMILVRRSRQLRAQVEQALAEAQGAFTVAAAVMSPEMLQQALMCPKQRLELETGTRNIMGVETPVYHLQWQNDDPADLLPYGFAQTSGELDTAIETMVSCRRCSSWRRRRRLCSCSQRTSKRRAAASTRWNTS